MKHPSGFFNEAYVSQEHAQYSFINVGKEPFHAVSVALIDALQSSSRGNDRVLKEILQRFAQHVPNYIKSTQPYLTLSERMKMLLDNFRHRKSELVDSMAYVLRQIAVDELYAHPLRYRDVFKGLNPEISKNYLRDPRIKLSVSALEALAQSLGVTITLSFQESEKELRKKEVYASTEHVLPATFTLTIQIQGQEECYFPRVKHKEYFIHMGQLVPRIAQSEINQNVEEANLTDIITLIEQDNKRLLHSYEHVRKTILGMVIAGELNCKQLLNLYITYYPVHSPMTSGSLFLLQSERKPVVGLAATQEQEMIEGIASALALWICTNQIKSDVLDQIESPSLSVFK